MMKRTVISCLAALSAVAAGVLFFYSFPEWLPPLYVLSVVLFAFTAGAIAGLYAKKKPLLKGLLAAAAYAAGLFSMTYLINNVMCPVRQMQFYRTDRTAQRHKTTITYEYALAI